MPQDRGEERRLSFERGVFLALAVLLVWRAWDYMTHRPPPLILRPARATLEEDLHRAAQVPSPPEEGALLASLARRDPFVPFVLARRETVELPAASDGGEASRPPPRRRPQTVVRRRPTPPKADPDAPLANLPAKPETAQPRPGAGAPLTEKEQKAFPLEVVGFTRLEDGGGWRVLVMPRPAEGESPTREYIAFAEGDEWDAPEGGSLQVLSIEGSSVVFEWSDGRRVRIDKDALRDYAPLLREVALPGEAAEAEAEDSPERRPPSLPVLKREESSRPLGASAEKPEPTPLGGEKGPDKTDIWNTKKLSQAELNRLLRSLQNDPELRARMLEKALAAPEE